MIAGMSIADRASAATEKGFMTGGGIGSVRCTEFIDAMATARQQGGIENPAGVRIIHQFTQYVLGFRTGYNMAKPGVFDIFAPLGEKAGNQALIWIDSWCVRNPSSTFDFGIFELLRLLESKSEEN